MKKGIFLLVVVMLTLSLFSDSKVLIATMSIEDGYEELYLQGGTYHFEIYAWVTTDDPFNELTDYYWNNYAEIEGDTWQDYGTAEWECEDQLFKCSTTNFGVQTSGNYDVKAGAYEVGGNVTVESNMAKLYRTKLNQVEE